MIYRRFYELGIIEIPEEVPFEGDTVGIDLGEKVFHLGALGNVKRLETSKGVRYNEYEILIEQNNIRRLGSIGLGLNGLFENGKYLNLKIKSKFIEAKIKKLEWGMSHIAKLMVIAKNI